MKKKWMKMVSVLLACCMMVSALAGCGSSSTDTESGSSSSDSEEIVELAVLFPILGSAPDDLDEVEEAVNEITESEIGVHITFVTASLSDAESEVTRMAAAGEQMDVLYALGVSSYINAGLVTPLNDLLDEYGEDIKEVLGGLLDAYQISGETYRLYSNSRYAEQYGVNFRTDILEKYGLSLDEGEYLTYEILDEWFATIKEGEGSSFYMFAMNGTSQVTSFASNLGAMTAVDTLGSDIYTGVFTDYDTDDYTIQNLFETEAFEEYQYWMNRWYEAGYVHPDAATITDSGQELMLTGNYLGYIGGAGIGMAEENTTNLGFDITTYLFEDSTCIVSAQYTNGWCISSTSENQEAAMKFLNLMYTNQDLINLIAIGIEGEHYVLTDDEGIVTYPDGVDASTVTYTGPIAVGVGDGSLQYRFAPYTSEILAELQEFNDEVVSLTSDTYDFNVSKAFGYVFDQTNVKSECSALSDVLTEYAGAILYGTQDPDTLISELNDALYAAGLSTVLEENQSQLDAWLAEQ